MGESYPGHYWDMVKEPGRDVPRLLWSEGGEYAMLAIDWLFASRPWLVEFQGLSY